MTWEKWPAKAPARLPGVISPARAVTGYVGVLRSQRRALLRRSERPVERVCRDRLGVDTTKVQECVYAFGSSREFMVNYRPFTAEERTAGYFGIRPIFSAGD